MVYVIFYCEELGQYKEWMRVFNDKEKAVRIYEELKKKYKYVTLKTCDIE